MENFWQPLAVFLAVAFAVSLRFIPKLRGYQFTAWIIAAVTTAMIFPQWFSKWGDFDLQNKWVKLLVVQTVMFGMGTQMSLHDFAGVVKNPRGVLVGDVVEGGEGCPIVAADSGELDQVPGLGGEPGGLDVDHDDAALLRCDPGGAVVVSECGGPTRPRCDGPRGALAVPLGDHLLRVGPHIGVGELGAVALVAGRASRDNLVGRDLKASDFGVADVDNNEGASGAEDVDVVLRLQHIPGRDPVFPRVRVGRGLAFHDGVKGASGGEGEPVHGDVAGGVGVKGLVGVDGLPGQGRGGGVVGRGLIGPLKISANL